MEILAAEEKLLGRKAPACDTKEIQHPCGCLLGFLFWVGLERLLTMDNVGVCISPPTKPSLTLTGPLMPQWSWGNLEQCGASSSCDFHLQKKMISWWLSEPETCHCQGCSLLSHLFELSFYFLENGFFGERKG